MFNPRARMRRDRTPLRYRLPVWLLQSARRAGRDFRHGIVDKRDTVGGILIIWPSFKAL